MILNIVLGTLLTLFISLSGYLAIQLLVVRNAVAEAMLKITILEQATKQALEKSSQSIEGNEGFLKFISESREWAFQYIETVQNGLDKFISEIDPLIQYFDAYGDQMGMLPNYESMKKISEEFKQLKELLPENDGSQ